MQDKKNIPTFQTLADKRQPKQEKRASSQRTSSPKKNENTRRTFVPSGNKKATDTKKSIWGNNTEIEMSKASTVGSQGTVKVQIKSSHSASKEKKSGPLSPRAPEIIKKNRAEEIKVYGEQACLALFSHRPHDIVRLWVTQAASKKAGEMMSWLAGQQKAYHVVNNTEMEKVTGTEHHGGFCLLVKKAKTLSLSGYLSLERKQDCLLLLDKVENALNLGGILRTCAFYGVKYIVAEQNHNIQSSATMRVAEGAFEYIKTLETANIDTAIQTLREHGYQVVRVTTNQQAQKLHQLSLQKKVAFVLTEIPNAQLLQQDTEVTLSSNNPLNTGLNIAVTTGVLLSYWYAQ